MTEKHSIAKAVAKLTGLATFFMRASRMQESSRCLRLAAALDGGDFRVLLAEARQAILAGEAGRAITALERTRETDPFDEEVCDLLGQLYRDQGATQLAAECFADAQVLSGGVDPERHEEYVRQLGELLDALGLSSAEERAGFYQERAERFEELAEGARREAEALLGAGTGDSTSPLHGTGPALAATPLFRVLDAAQIGKLEAIVQRWRVPEGGAIFREGQPSEDIYLVERGKVVIQRATPFGTQVLATVRRGSLFGEMNFIDGLSRSADAMAVEQVDLAKIPHGPLRKLFEEDRRLAAACLREFFQGLAEKVREGNELMKSFFPEEGGSAPAAPRPEATTATGRKAGVAPAAKAGVLRKHDLTGEDMRVLADFAEAESFDIDQAVFREGDAADSLFIVFEGKVRISKHIPGVGEEALAILERGDFFGEMALLDQAPRSATATAHLPGTTVLRIARTAIEDLLERNPEAASDFMLILCRILSGRLREMNDKIVQWKMMSGGF